MKMIKLKSEHSYSSGVLMKSEDPVLFQDMDNPSDILSNGSESKIEYESPKKLEISVSSDKIKLKICKSEPKIQILFEESMKKLNNLIN